MSLARPGFLFVALLTVAACSGNETSPGGGRGGTTGGSGGAPAGGGGNAGSAGVAAAGGGSGGKTGEDCLALCISSATLLADMPLSLEAARMEELEACRNAECFTGTLGEDGQWHPPVQVGAETTAFVVVNSGAVRLSWSFGRGQNGVNGDRYRLSFGDTTVIDEEVTYENVTICGNECTQAAVDRRGQSTGGVGGVGGSAGAEGGAGGSGGATD